MHSCFPSFFQASLVQNETEKITFQNPDFADQHLKAIANRLGSQSLYWSSTKTLEDNTRAPKDAFRLKREESQKSFLRGVRQIWRCSFFRFFVYCPETSKASGTVVKISWACISADPNRLNLSSRFLFSWLELQRQRLLPLSSYPCLPLTKTPILQPFSSEAESRFHPKVCLRVVVALAPKATVYYHWKKCCFRFFNLK